MDRDGRDEVLEGVEQRPGVEGRSVEHRQRLGRRLQRRDPAAERAAKFDRLDKAKDGKFTREYYTANQSDAVAAAGRFEKMDTNKDGVVTREEYISNGKKQK